jgi:hypothetical protein
MSRNERGTDEGHCHHDHARLHCDGQRGGGGRHRGRDRYRSGCEPKTLGVVRNVCLAREESLGKGNVIVSTPAFIAIVAGVLVAGAAAGAAVAVAAQPKR